MVKQLIMTMAMTYLIFSSCSFEDKGLRRIRGHSIDKQGIAHGASAMHAERYCSSCHGSQLLGGQAAQASCYKCHGQLWEMTQSQQIFADANHSEDRGGFMHHLSIKQAVSMCSTCHGTDLQGTDDQGPPSCYLCHDQLWAP